MAEKGIYSPVVRKIITVALFIGITGTFIGLYYFIYLPQQEASYNLRTFRILHEIANNFSRKILNNGISYSYSNGYISRSNEEPKLHFKNLISNSDSAFEAYLKKSFVGDPTKIDSFSSTQYLEQDSITYKIKLKKVNETIDSLKKSLKEILDPLISIHPNTFESVLLIKQNPDTIKGTKNVSRYDSILYESEKTNITRINTDTLLFKSNVETSDIRNIDIEGTRYRIFLTPFQINTISNETFVLIGIIKEENYKLQTQSIPLQFLLALALILVTLLMALPFVKIFILSIHENITVADVRVIIAAIFIIPFVITLFCSSLWMNIYCKRYATDILSSLQQEVTDNFYKEIAQTIRQAKDYNSLIEDPRAHFVKDSSKARLVEKIPGVDTVNIKDYIFYPRYYKNLDNVHWMDEDGNDIASWTFINDPPGYFRVKDRQYFQDIIRHGGYVLPNPYFSQVKDTFGIQATLSRLTGRYAINVSLPSNIEISPQKKAAAIAISTKMYSIYNTATPPGFSYCLIDERGNMIFHSDTAKSLQENLIVESEDNQELITAIKHKDSVTIEDMDLYDKPVGMMVKPLPTLPYYFVTYYQKRGGYLFTFHVGAFVFVCESIILLFASLFSFSIMVSGKRISKLFFVPGLFQWIKPSPRRVKYYHKNYLQLIVSVLLIYLISFFISAENIYLYMLNSAVLLPLFAVTGYYIIKKGPQFIYLQRHANNRDRHLIFRKKRFLHFLFSIKNILLLYAVSIAFFLILQNVLFYDHFNSNQLEITASILTLIILLPLTMFIIAGADSEAVVAKSKKVVYFTGFRKENAQNDSAYLNHFIISLLLSVTVICVIPAISLIAYAFHEEKQLHVESSQVELAKRVQQRRTGINKKLKQTKIGLVPNIGEAFSDSLKFSPDKGLYLSDNIIRKEFFKNGSTINNSGLPCYKAITKFLFLPPDHDEFFDNKSHNSFYYWTKSGNEKKEDFLQLHYKNTTDYLNSFSFSLTGNFTRFSFADFLFRTYTGLFLLLAVIIFIYLFYRLIYSIAKRIFLVGYFENNIAKNNTEDADWLKQKYNYINRYDFNNLFSSAEEEISFAAIRRNEKKLLKKNDGGEGILKMHLALLPVYESIWKDCSNVEKYTLYDFALDGFTNYKKVLILYQLYRKGLLIKDEDDNPALMTESFRNFLITKETSEEIRILSKEGKGSWATIRTVFYIILVAVAAFIFISQEEASKRLITIVTSLGALLPAMLKLFDKSTFTSPANKSSQ